jgi:hypothetical protein
VSKTEIEKRRPRASSAPFSASPKSRSANRAIPDAPPSRAGGGAVERLPRQRRSQCREDEAVPLRIASFDKQALAAVKSLVNRHGLPTQDELASSSAMFRQPVSWEGAKARIAPLIKAGLSKPGDFELRLGHHLGHLMALAADKAGMTGRRGARIEQ